MSQDVRTLVLSLSREANRFLHRGDHPPITGATINAWGQLQWVEPPPLQRYTPRRQIEHLEASYRREAKEGLCRACAHVLEVNVLDPAGRDRVALLVSVETAAGLALDVFLPLADPEHPRAGGVDVSATFASPRPPRVFVAGPRPAQGLGKAANDSFPLSGPFETSHESRARIQTRLLAAIVRGDIAGMGRAFDQGARLDEPLLGQTPVEMALRAREAEALDWLLSRDAPLPEVDLTRLRELDRPPTRPLLDLLERHGLQFPLRHRVRTGLVELWQRLRR